MSGAGAGADRDVDDDEMPGPSHSPPNQQHTREVLVTETLVYTHPDDICDWSDDTRDWPDVRGPDITYYLLHTKACDLKDVACYKSLPSFNYLQSGWVGKVMVHKWNQGTKRNVQPGKIAEMTFHLQPATVDPEVQRQPAAANVLLSEGEIHEMQRDSGYPDLFSIPGTLLCQTFHAPVRQARPVQDQPQPHSTHKTPSTLPGSCTRCSDFYKKFVALTPRAVAELEKKTRNQNTELWMVARQLRITASNVKKVPKRSTTSCEKAVRSIIQSTFSGNAATKHGKRYESLARNQFTSETGLATTPCGTVVLVVMPWLSASPDGLVEQTSGILEVKCPFVMDCKELVCSGKYDVRNVGNTYVLARNGPNGYYAQVQFQLYCTSRKLCYFYVWSVKSSILVEVPFDSTYINECIPRLHTFYFVSCCQSWKNGTRAESWQFAGIMPLFASSKHSTNVS
ncbi:uncharacterized protein LOC144179516 isoform X2 [Haemaphysalis longicornis]